jgi:hypothetical protein
MNDIIIIIILSSLSLFAAIFWHFLFEWSRTAPNWVFTVGAMSAIRAIVVTILFFAIVVASSSRVVDGSHQPHSKTTLNVGYLTAIKGDLKDRQGLAISGAIQLALEEINNDPKILPNVYLDLWWNDTRSDTVIATRAITEMICNGVSIIFGPEGTCHVEAIVTQSRNIPMIAYVSFKYISLSLSLSFHNRLFRTEMFRLYSKLNSHIRTNRAPRYSSE